MTTIATARDQQMDGKFSMPVALAKRMRTDDALFVAYRGRLAPENAISVALEQSPMDTTGCVVNEAQAWFADEGVGLVPGATQTIVGDLANHAVAIGYNDIFTRADGSRKDFVMRPWPLEFVRYDKLTGGLVTRTDGGIEVPIVHGDGRWTVFTEQALEPWAHCAAVLAAGAVWGIHAFGIKDWGKSSKAHGDAKFLGTLGENVPIQQTDTDGNVVLTEQAVGMLAVLQAMYDSEAPYGLVPMGAKLESIANGSNAWQVFEKLILNREKAAARIYLGTDGILGSVGGAPGVDITALFGVATTIVQGDLWAIERGLLRGVIEPWAAVNYGDSRLAPIRRYQIPDADADAVRAAFATRNKAFNEDVKSYRENGFQVTQGLIDMIADKHGVPAPSLASLNSGGEIYAYHIESGVVTIDEVRAKLGLPPLPDGAGAMTSTGTAALASTGLAPGGAPLATTDMEVEGEEVDPGEPATLSDRQALADKMTAEKVEACSHGAKNRCRLCGIERVRDFERDPESGEIVWMVIWKPIEE